MDNWRGEKLTAEQNFWEWAYTYLGAYTVLKDCTGKYIVGYLDENKYTRIAGALHEIVGTFVRKFGYEWYDVDPLKQKRRALDRAYKTRKRWNRRIFELKKEIQNDVNLPQAN